MSYIKRRRYVLYNFLVNLSDVCLYSYAPSSPGRAVMNLVSYHPQPHPSHNGLRRVIGWPRVQGAVTGPRASLLATHITREGCLPKSSAWSWAAAKIFGRAAENQPTAHARDFFRFATLSVTHPRLLDMFASSMVGSICHEGALGNVNSFLTY